MSRNVGDKVQKILILGDADCISNGEFGRSRRDIRAANFGVIAGAFYWLSDEEVPIDVRRPDIPDKEIYIGRDGMKTTKILFMAGLPGILLLLALFIWFRRRGK